MNYMYPKNMKNATFSWFFSQFIELWWCTWQHVQQNITVTMFILLYQLMLLAHLKTIQKLFLFVPLHIRFLGNFLKQIKVLSITRLTSPVVHKLACIQCLCKVINNPEIFMSHVKWETYMCWTIPRLSFQNYKAIRWQL